MSLEPAVSQEQHRWRVNCRDLREIAFEYKSEDLKLLRQLNPKSQCEGDSRKVCESEHLYRINRIERQ